MAVQPAISTNRMKRAEHDRESYRHMTRASRFLRKFIQCCVFRAGIKPSSFSFSRSDYANSVLWRILSQEYMVVSVLFREASPVILAKEHQLVAVSSSPPNQIPRFVDYSSYFLVGGRYVLFSTVDDRKP